MSYHMVGTTPGPWAGHRGSWGDGQDPTSLTQAVASLLPWRWFPVLSSVEISAVHKPLNVSILMLLFPPQPSSKTPLRFITFSYERGQKTDLLRWGGKGPVWTGSSVNWIFWKYNIQYLMTNRDTGISFTTLHIHQPDGKERHRRALPLSAMMTAAPRELRVCGCTTRKAACRLYVKGTQARSPNTSMKPNPSCTMSMVVRTASCSNTTAQISPEQQMRANARAIFVCVSVFNYRYLLFHLSTLT